MGRHSTFTQEKADEICARMEEGETLSEICRSPGMPKRRTVYDWCAEYKEFAAQFARARDVGFDAIADETVRIIDEMPERTNTEHGDKVDSGYVAWQKNRVEQRLKLLAKWSPNRYGDKLALEHSGSVSIADTLRAAKEKRREGNKS